MQSTLRLVAARTAHREIVAWFLPGHDPQNWLQELSRWNIPLGSVTFRPVPRSRTAIDTIGALVSLSGIAWKASNPNSHWTERSGKNAIPYGLVAGRVFVPVDGDLFPAVDDAELKDLLPGSESEFIWHPSSGLVRIDAENQFRIVDLLSPPAERRSDWNRAVTGTAIRSRLISVEPEITPTADDVLGAAASDIGSRGDSLKTLPPTPDELFGGKLNDWTRSIRNLLRGLFKPKPKSSETPQSQKPRESTKSDGGWLSSAAAQAAGFLGRGLGSAIRPFAGAAGKILDRLASMPFIDQLARNREIDRLLNLLKSDPDEGLRYALPMGGSDDSRGTANPSNRLVPRSVGFNLGHFDGGTAADFWDIQAEQRYQLIQQYRELAAREIRLGRHRRAAYIFANLLGDFSAAAGALEAGSHYRDAAAIYRDRLNQPVDAARCLEKGGLLDEAALLYVELGMFEAAADLYVRLERHDEAERLLRSWATQLIANQDFPNACRVLHEKLHDVDGALSALSTGWPFSASAMFCLDESFRLLGLHGRHDAAMDRVIDLRANSTILKTKKLAVRGLANVATNYPDHSVRERAIDTAQMIAADGLRTANVHEAGEILESVTKLAPQDRLLSRDAARYLRLRQPAPQPQTRRQTRGITQQGSFSISKESINWKIAKSAGDVVYIVGYGNGSLVLNRLSWKNRELSNQNSFWAGISDARQIILEPFPGDAGDVLVHAVGAEPLERRGLQFTRIGPNTINMVGAPPWATKSTIAMAYSQGGTGWRIREIFGTLELACFGPKGEPLAVKDLAVPFDSDSTESPRVTLLVNSKSPRISVDQFLCRPKLTSGIPQEVLPIDCTALDDTIQSMTASRPEDGAWLIVLFETGALLIDDEDHNRRIAIAQDLHSPRATFLRGGRFVIAGGRQVRVYEITNSYPVLLGQSILDHTGTAIGVTPTDRVGEFAVFGADGTVQIFTIQPG